MSESDRYKLLADKRPLDLTPAAFLLFHGDPTFPFLSSISYYHPPQLVPTGVNPMPQNATPDYYFYMVFGGIILIAILLYLIFRKDDRPAGVLFYIVTGLIGFLLLSFVFNWWNDAYVKGIENLIQPYSKSK